MFVVGCSIYIYGFVCQYVWHMYGNTSCFFPFPIRDKLLSICALFWRDVDETISWIKEKGQLMASDDFGRDLASVQALLRKHEGLERDLAALEDKVPLQDVFYLQFKQGNLLVKGWKLTHSLCLGLGEGPVCRSWPFAAVSPNKCFPNSSKTGGAHCQLGTDPDAGSGEARSPQWLLQVGHCSRAVVLPSLFTFDWGLPGRTPDLVNPLPYLGLSMDPVISCCLWHHGRTLKDCARISEGTATTGITLSTRITFPEVVAGPWRHKIKIYKSALIAALITIII